MSKADQLAEQAGMAERMATITGAEADQAQYTQWKTAKEENEAEDLRKALRAAAPAPAPAPDPDPPANSSAATGRRLLQSPRRFISGGASNSQSSSETREQADSASDTLSNSVMKFYGCTPSQDPIAWCNSCAGKPVAIEYSMAPLSTLISQVTRSSFR